MYAVRLDAYRLVAIAAICLIGTLIADLVSLRGTLPIIPRFGVHLGITLVCGDFVGLPVTLSVPRAVSRGGSAPAPG